MATPSSSLPASSARPWSAATRVAFRFVFCYIAQYALCCGNATVWRAIPWLGGHLLEPLFARPYMLAAQWLGEHLLHLQGPGAHLHASGYGDRALDWLAAGIMLAIAALALSLIHISFHIPTLLVLAGLASSKGEAQRKIKENAVSLNGEKTSAVTVTQEALGNTPTLRLGKKSVRVKWIE